MITRVSAAVAFVMSCIGISAVALYAQNANELYDIVYRNTNGRELMLDISRPQPEGVARPAIVFLCGNGWGYDKSINREQFSFALDLAVANGYVGVTVDYSSTVENPYHRALGIFPWQVYDVKSAIRFLRANAKSFDIDPSRIGVVGFSSGANLALMLAFTRPTDGLEGVDDYLQYSSAVQAVVNFSAVSDLVSWDLEPYVSAYIGGSLDSRPELFRRASPVEYIWPGTPPVLTIHGDKDAAVLPEQAFLLDRKMKEVGARHTLIMRAGYGHGFDFDETVWNFLDKVLSERRQCRSVNGPVNSDNGRRVRRSGSESR
jgi:acetyl esterase/lipase